MLLGRFLGVSVDSTNGIWGAGPAGLFGPLPAVTRVEEDNSAVVLTVDSAAKERSLLEAIDKAVERHDQNAKKTQARSS